VPDLYQTLLRCGAATMTHPAKTEEQRFQIVSTPDVERARRAARDLARRVGFDAGDSEAVALAVSEFATNLVRYALDGAISLSVVEEATTGFGVQVRSSDAGPGIANVERAMEDGFSTGGGLGNGLPAARRLMDEFELTSGPAGTAIVARKWARPTSSHRSC
jgi:serine/threonine-protein kinase RsbT